MTSIRRHAIILESTAKGARELVLALAVGIRLESIIQQSNQNGNDMSVATAVNESLFLLFFSTKQTHKFRHVVSWMSVI